jgi:serine/threonine-protein kinase HipA
MRRAEVYTDDTAAGILEETETGYRFQYHADYVNDADCKAISLTMPKQIEAYYCAELFSFFSGLLTEGITMQLQCQMLKIDSNDIFGRLLKTVHDDTIGNITIRELAEE